MLLVLRIYIAVWYIHIVTESAFQVLLTEVLYILQVVAVRSSPDLLERHSPGR